MNMTVVYFCQWVQRVIARLCIGPLLAFFFLVHPLQAQVKEDSSAADWAARMGKALREQSYSGVYTYIRGRKFDTVRITHQFLDGVEKERLFYLNGEPREVLRDGDEVVCYHRENDPHELDHELSMLGPFTRLFNDELATYRDMYKFSLHGTSRIADRVAVHLAIKPIHNDRYGYRLWLDEETGLLLQSHLVNQNRVLEVFQFVDVAIGELSEGDVALLNNPKRDPKREEMLSHLISPFRENDKQETFPSSKVSHAPDKIRLWQAKWLPTGFRPVSPAGKGGPMVFSDGVTSLSVFVENSKGGSIPEIRTYSGGTVILSRERKLPHGTQRITIVGKIPLETAERVVDSIEPDIK